MVPQLWKFTSIGELVILALISAMADIPLRECQDYNLIPMINFPGIRGISLDIPEINEQGSIGMRVHL